MAVSLESELAGERELVAALQMGDATAYETLVRREAPRMLATARRYSDSDEDAREVVQEAFASAFQALPKFQGNALLSTWLHRIVVNASLARVHRRARRPEVALDALLPRFSDGGHFLESPSTWRPDTAVEQDELRGVVQAAIAKLPESYRDVLVLRDIQGVEVEVVAAELGLSANAVRIRTHRARQALRTLLDPHLRDTTV